MFLVHSMFVEGVAPFNVASSFRPYIVRPTCALCEQRRNMERSFTLQSLSEQTTVSSRPSSTPVYIDLFFHCGRSYWVKGDSDTQAATAAAAAAAEEQQPWRRRAAASRRHPAPPGRTRRHGHTNRQTALQPCSSVRIIIH